MDLPLLRSRLAELDKTKRDAILAQLEHIRWSRYHDLHNWTWGPGKKDLARRTHPDLTPYSRLSRADIYKMLGDYPDDELLSWLPPQRERQGVPIRGGRPGGGGQPPEHAGLRGQLGG